MTGIGGWAATPCCAFLPIPLPPGSAITREADARVLSPYPYAMTVATGRPNASGFRQYVHLIPYTGPEYLDAIRHLEPEALRRLDVRFLHATDDWVARLPDRARRWLANPEFFDLLARVGTHSLYGVKPEFHRLSEPPSSGSFGALRQTAPTGAKVYVSPALAPLNAFRAMAMLTHHESPRVGGPNGLEPLARQHSDRTSRSTNARLGAGIVPPRAVDVCPRTDAVPFGGTKTSPLFSPSGSVAPVSPHSPPILPASSCPTRARLTTSSPLRRHYPMMVAMDGRDRTGWSCRLTTRHGPFQEPWPIDKAPQWFAGQNPLRSPGTIIRDYEFDPGTATLALRDQDGNRSFLPSAGSKLNPGSWLLGVRPTRRLPPYSIHSGGQIRDFSVWQGLVSRLRRRACK